MISRVTAIDYVTRDEETIVQLAGRGEDGSRVTCRVHGTRPRLYVPVDEPVPNEKFITGVEEGYESFDGIPLKRVYTKTPQQSGDLAKEFDAAWDAEMNAFSDTWESDIPYYRLVSMVYGLSGYIDVPDGEDVHIDDINTDIDESAIDKIEPRVVMADIEVIPDMDMPINEMVESAHQPITNITVYDTQDEQYTSFVLDPDDTLEPAGIKESLDEYWSGEAAFDKWKYDSEEMAYVLVDELEARDEWREDIELEICGTEETLLGSFISYIERVRPDLLSGWNWVNFDHKYLLNRIEVLNEELGDYEIDIHRLSDIGWVNGWTVDRMIDCLPGFDMMDAFAGTMTQNELRSRALDYVAQEEVDAGKVRGVDPSTAFEKERERLAAYNIIDVQLCVELDDKHQIHDYFYSLAEMSQIQIYDTFSEMRIADGWILHQRDDDEVMPSADEEDVPENAGGLVLPPYEGIAEWVGVFDVKSLYPSAMVTWNISPETVEFLDTPNADEVLGNDGADLYIPWVPKPDDIGDREVEEEEIRFDVMGSTLQKEGIIPKYLRMLFDLREEYKSLRDEHDSDSVQYEVYDRRQANTKIIMNAFYGISSNKYWRFSRPGLGDAITSAARFVLWVGKEIAKLNDETVLYGDTDAVIIELGNGNSELEDIAEDGFSFLRTINDSIGWAVTRSGLDKEVNHPFLKDGDLHGTTRHALVFEYEKVYRSYLQAGKKKRYAGLTVMKDGEELDEPDVDITGFDSVRSNAPILTENVFPDTLKLLLAGADFGELSEYLQRILSSIENLELPLHHIARPGVLKRPIEEYKSTTISTKASAYSNEYLGYNWQPGERMWVYHVNETPAMQDTDVIALEWNDDLPDGYGINEEKIIEIALENPLTPILDVVGYNFTELKSGAETQDALDTDWGGGDSGVDGPKSSEGILEW